MIKLNLPEYSLKIIAKDGKYQVFDRIRKKYVALTEEEWVRQNFIHYLISEKNFPEQMMAVEASLKLHGMERRADIVVYGADAKPALIVECKASSVMISQEVFDQVARYNITLRVPHLIVTNGLVHFYCRIDHVKNTFAFVEDIPGYGMLNERGI